MLFYYYLGIGIDYLLIFFCLRFKVNFDDFSKNFAFKIHISIFIKHTSSNLVIVFIIENNIQSR